jgi:RES domain-containing protein
MHLQTICYRAINPVWAGDPLSGEGARRFGGRFNAKGRAALYTTLDPVTAVREVSQIGQPLQPTLLVSYAVDLLPVFNGTEADLLASQGVTPAMLAADDWRLSNPSPTQIFAERLIEQGFVALLVPSYARLAPPQARNLVIWQWDQPGQARVIDDERRMMGQGG